MPTFKNATWMGKLFSIINLRNPKDSVGKKSLIPNLRKLGIS
jgi:hypothetical protein